MLEKILDRFREKELELEVEDAADIYRERNGKKLEAARQKTSEIRSRMEEAMQGLSKALEEMEEHEDYADRKIVEDVMENIASDRRELVERTELSEDPEELKDEIQQFMEEFHSLSQKEEAVMDEAVLPKSFEKSVNSLEKETKSLEKFLEDEYEIIRTEKFLEQKLDDIKQLRKEIERVKDDLAGRNIESLEKKEEEKREELEEFRESEKWQKYLEMQEELEELEEEKRKEKNRLEKTLGNMRRGLKKLLYQAENGDIELDFEKLVEEMKDKKASRILDKTAEDVEKAAEELEESLPGDLLAESQRKKFLENLEALKRFGELKQEIRSIEEEIDEVESSLDGSDADSEKRRLEGELRQKKERLEEERDRIEELESRLEKRERELERKKDEIREELGSVLSLEITLLESAGD